VVCASFKKKGTGSSGISNMIVMNDLSEEIIHDDHLRDYMWERR